MAKRQSAGRAHPNARMIKPGKVTQPIDPQAPQKRRPINEPIKVRATALGYYGEMRRRVGDVFICSAEAFSPEWMEEVDPRTRERVTSAPQALKRAHDEILGGQVTGRANDDDVLGN